MWNFLFRRGQRQRAQSLRFTFIAPETRGQDETMALRENINDLGAAAALQEAIEASRPPSSRTMSSQTMSLHVTTHVSAVSADSEDFIRNPYSDSGRRQQRQAITSPTSPLAVVFPAQSPDPTEEDYVDVNRPSGEEEEQQPQSIRRNLIMDPLGTLLHMTAAASLVSGSPGRQYFTSGPPPPEQRGRRSQSCSHVTGVLPTPLPLVLTLRPRAVSSPVYSDRPRIHARARSARTL